LSQVIFKNPTELLRLARTAWTTAKFRWIQRCAGGGTTIEPLTRIVNSANVRIGRGCLIKEAVYLRAGPEGRITLGDRVAINAHTRIYGHGGVDIGEDSQLGPGVTITTTDHDWANNLEARFVPVTLGKFVWIGANVTILPGVEIGDHSVVGAGAVVSKSIPPRSVAVGVPAKVIKSVDDLRGS
jgi:acetyltransferase-like isoleucine patch superfamily enzyme